MRYVSNTLDISTRASNARSDSFTVITESLMVPLARFQTICVLAGGILLGYLAASDRLNPFPQARAASGPRDAERGAESPEAGGSSHDGQLL